MYLLLNLFAKSHTKKTESTEKSIKHLLKYFFTHIDAIIEYQQRSMKLYTHIDAL